MGYQRAGWHSGLTYSQTCETCHTKVDYTDYKLGYRPWYPDGFVYCPKCKTPLRHNEKYAINGADAGVVAEVEPVVSDAPAGTSLFCSKCGRAFQADENFCPKCGNKR